MTACGPVVVECFDPRFKAFEPHFQLQLHKSYTPVNERRSLHRQQNSAPLDAAWQQAEESQPDLV